MNDVSDDVLRDLLLARGVSEETIQQLVDVVNRAIWVEACARPASSVLPHESLDVAIASLDADLDHISRQYAPKRPFGPMPSFADLNAAFRSAWQVAPDPPPFDFWTAYVGSGLIPAPAVVHSVTIDDGDDESR